MKDFFIKGGVAFLLCGYLSQAAASGQTSSLVDEFKAQVIEKIKARASHIIELNDQNIPLQHSKDDDFIVIESERLRKKAKEYKEAGDEIQANLYEAKVKMADLKLEQSVLLDTEGNTAQALLAVSRTKDRRTHGQIEKYVEFVIYKKSWEYPHTLLKVLARLHEAEAAYYAATGQKDKSEKYKNAGNETQANFYKQEAFSLYNNLEPPGMDDTEKMGLSFGVLR